MKKSSDIIGNQTHDLPACKAVPHPTAPPRAPADGRKIIKYFLVEEREWFKLIYVAESRNQ